MKIVLNDIEMSTGVADSDGSLWYVTEMEGWESPPTRLSSIDPSTKHGAVLTEGLYGARAVVLKGVCKATSEANFWKAYNHLLGSTSGLGVPFDLTVSEDIDKRLGVVRSGNIRQAFKGIGTFEFEVPLLAPDPLKYEVTETSTTIGAGGTATITNAGNFSTYPVITSGGDVSVENFTTALTVFTAAAVPSGTVFDTLNRTIYSGATNNYEKIAPSSTWWTLLPGANEIRNHGSASATITHHNAWI